MQDIKNSRLQFSALVHGGMLSALTGLQHHHRNFAQPLLHSVVIAVVSSGCRHLAEGVPYRQLSWLVETGHGGSREDVVDVLQSLVHEAWYRWHQSLWKGVAAALPAAHAAALSSSAKQNWTMFSGPLQLHAAMVTVHASALGVSSESVPIFDRDAKLLQLKLAARHLRSQGSSQQEILMAEHAAAAAVLAATLAAYLPSISSADAAFELQVIINRLLSPVDSSVSDTVEALAALRRVVEASDDHGLRSLLDLLLLCTEGVLKPKNPAGEFTTPIATHYRSTSS